MRSNKLTFNQLINTGDFPSIQSVDGSDPLGQVDIVRQRARQFGQQCVKGPEPVRGDRIHYPIKVAVSVAVEADLHGSFLRAQSLQGPGPIQAAVGAVRWARHSVHLGAGATEPLTFVPLIEMLHLHVAAETDEYGCTVFGKQREKKGCDGKLYL